MNPFFFGAAERRLFGIYEPAISGNVGRRAAILCNPMGAEYFYAHRSIRQLGLRLSNSGFHTLRFDFYGTGDSGGEAADADLSGWQADIETAIEELNEITGIAKVALIGMRLGGSIAAAAAMRIPSALDSLVLWDPIVSGRDYLSRLGVKSGATAPIEVQGFPLSERMLAELTTFDLRSLNSQDRPRSLTLITERFSFDEQLGSTDGQTSLHSVEYLEDVRPWLENSSISGKVPSSVMLKISNWLQ
jgi:uncharacterized protein